MSLRLHPYLVIWDDLVDQWQRHQNTDFFWTAIESSEAWVQRYEAENWNDGSNSAHRFSEMYEELRQGLPKRIRTPFDTFFQAFFWWNEEGDINTPVYEQDLTEEWGDGTFGVTMKPATIHKYMKLLPFMPLEQLRKPFNDFICEGEEEVENEFGNMDSFQTFHDYVSQWIDLLRCASKAGRGIVITIV